ncbi:hypothetical protein H8K32_19265 [Undibacterium jejuense]|uniref:Lipoprotein n=1 Tax=Undibacterium jejuense TaxID=1344949 RepID=A0A923HT50_9BURK|nr:hypothetical protein [Undibacterium jejuense]MBC3864248.1 hypothetical protein [Undibacterium jejuense]
MKLKIVVGTLIALTLAACGGGGNGSNTTSTNSGSGSGSGSSGGTGGTITNCAIANTHPLIAVALTGGAGSAQFSNGGTTLTYSGNLSGTLNLVQDANAPAPLNKACMDSTGNSNTSMRTVMQSNGALGVSHTLVNGNDQPVFLMDSTALASNTNLGALQGTYNVLRYQHDTGSTPAQTRMSYATITIDNLGNWSMCKNTSTCSTATATGNFAAHSGSSYAFDLSSGGLVRATAFMVGTGANSTLVVTENDTGGGGIVTGMWLGVPQTAWNPVAGSYVLNTTDGIQNPLTASLQNLIVKSQNIALTANTPITGIATATVSDGTINYLISSPAGLLVTGNNTGNNFANGPAYFSFGVMP